MLARSTSCQFNRGTGVQNNNNRHKMKCVGLKLDWFIRIHRPNTLRYMLNNIFKTFTNRPISHITKG